VAEWVGGVEEQVGSCGTRAVLAAHSLACSLVAHWASRPGARAAGALLVAPADVDSPAHTADEVRNFSPVPLAPLPFPSIVVASTHAPLVTPAPPPPFARAWGSGPAPLEHAGHLNADAGFGPWPEGRRLLAELTRSL